MELFPELFDFVFPFSILSPFSSSKEWKSGNQQTGYKRGGGGVRRGGCGERKKGKKKKKEFIASRTCVFLILKEINIWWQGEWPLALNLGTKFHRVSFRNLNF